MSDRAFVRSVRREPSDASRGPSPSPGPFNTAASRQRPRSCGLGDEPCASGAWRPSTEKLVSDFGHSPAQVAGTVEFLLARLTTAITTGNRGRSIGCTTDHLVVPRLSSKAIVESDDDHPEVEQICDDREERCLLPAMLGRGRGEGRTDLAVECATCPEAASLIEEVRHLGRYTTIARAGADDDRVILLE